MRNILILGAGKSTTVLINTLLKDAQVNDWMVHVADGDPEAAAFKIDGHVRGKAYPLNISETESWHALIHASDLVISMLPPSYHVVIAKQCLISGKHFLNASYMTDEMKSLDSLAKEKGLIFLNEMGLDPGIDHMSAMEMMDDIKNKGGEIISFKSHCGGLISPESDNNPWHYKISWNPRNIITAGKDGAIFLEDGRVVEMSYQTLFDPERIVDIPGVGKYAWYPNRNSINYQQLYQLPHVKDLIRTTLRHPDFCKIWNLLVNSGLTSETELFDSNSIRYDSYFKQKLKQHSLIDSSIIDQLNFIGAFNNDYINLGKVSAADVLQYLLEKSLRLEVGDKDMIIMLHEIGYTLEGVYKNLKATLMVKGENEYDTAMAKTVGLPLAIGATLILNNVIQLKGVHIPICKEIYTPVLKKLVGLGIHFKTMV